MKSFIILFLLFTTFNLYSSLANASTLSDDWTIKDIEGKSYNLNNMLEKGKSVMLFFSTTWCRVSWQVVENKVLDNIYDTYGAEGTNELVLLFIESDPNTNSNHLKGITTEQDTNYTMGDWVTKHKYPIINEETLAKKYKVNAYPTNILLSKDKAPTRIMGGTNLTADAIGKWLGNSSYIDKSTNDNSTCAASDVDVYLNGLDYKSVKDELLNYLEKKYNFKTWTTVTHSKVDIFEKCQGNICHKVAIEDRGNKIGIQIAKSVQDGKNKKTSALLYVVSKNPNKPKPGFALQVSEFKNSKQVFGNGIAIQYKKQCDNTKPYSQDAQRNLSKNKEKLLDEHYIEAYEVCSQKPFYSVLNDN